MDFVLFETLERYLCFVPGCLANFPNLASFHKRISELQAIAKYRSSPQFQRIKTRFNGRSAKFGVGEY